MEKIDRAQVEFALTKPTQPSTRHLLPESDYEQLTIVLRQLQRRYQHQDLSDSVQDLLMDYEALALRYSLAAVIGVLRELRITPGQAYFPRPDEVAQLLE